MWSCFRALWRTFFSKQVVLVSLPLGEPSFLNQLSRFRALWRDSCQHWESMVGRPLKFPSGVCTPNTHRFSKCPESGLTLALDIFWLLIQSISISNSIDYRFSGWHWLIIQAWDSVRKFLISGNFDLEIPSIVWSQCVFETIFENFRKFSHFRIFFHLPISCLIIS